MIFEKRFYNDDLKIKCFMENELMVTMIQHHPLAHYLTLTFANMQQYEFVIHISGSTRESINEWCHDNLIFLNIRMHSNSLSSILETIQHYKM
ncbi:LysR substrate-binding domain-containing protein [Staphylococcus saccharolyticus]|uniref:LysR substrate-binding domain-containing protein n=1 Tax=Staphylococcus saccharolyticus TaxID=33028 RepID=UPI0023B1B260|nr:LysR substrate-binding domain-containing protein [Staphylococcus saccharolyticus]